MPVVTFRELGEGDLAAVAAIEAQVSDMPWSLELFAGELELHQAVRHWLVAVDGDDLVGFGGMMYVDSDGHLMNIAVRPDRSRRGLGRQLAARLFREAVDRGVRNITLEVRLSNVPARELYRRFRMAPVGVRPRYYPDGEDALVMWAHDVDRDDYRSFLDELVAEVNPDV